MLRTSFWENFSELELERRKLGLHGEQKLSNVSCWRNKQDANARGATMTDYFTNVIVGYTLCSNEAVELG